MNKIWRVAHPEAEDNTLQMAVFNFLRNRLLAFILVFSSAALIVVSLISNVVIRVLLELIINIAWIRQTLETTLQINDLQLLRSLQATFTYFLMAAVVMTLFKVLPSTPIAWRDVWLGGLVTTGLLFLLQQLVSNSIIQLGGQFRSYGVVGSVMVLMLWLFLTCQSFLLGSEMTYVYAHLWGSRCGLKPAGFTGWGQRV